MSDAFWSTFNSFFWPALFLFLGGVVVQIPLIIAAIKSNRKLNDVKTAALATREELTAQVCDVQNHLSSIAMKKEDVESLIKGRERELAEKFIEIGRQQMSGPMPLDDKYPLGTRRDI